MAVSNIPSNISDIKIVHTYASPSGSLAAYSGAAVSLTPTIPDGYAILTHYAVWNVGVPGVIVSFDGGESTATAATVPVYQYNARNVTASSRGTIHMLTACYK